MPFRSFRDAPGGAWTGDLVAGASLAPIVLPSLMATGVVMMQPLGPGWFAFGITGALASCAAVALLRAMTDRGTLHVNAPRPTQAAMLAGLMAEVAAGPALASADPAARATLMLGAAFLGLLLAGLVQCALGLARIGSVIRYVPFPVVAGFSNGFAVAIALGQVPHLVGHNDWPSLRAGLAELSPWPLVTGLVALVVTLLAQKLGGRWPGGLIGLAAGALAYALLGLVLPGAELGPLIGALPEGLPFAWSGGGIAEVVLLPGFLQQVAMPVLATAVALALVSSLQSLISLASADALLRRRSDGDAELVRQGLGNMASALCSGSPNGGSPLYTRVALQSGGQGRGTQLSLALLLLLCALALSDVVAMIPVAAMAGVLIATTIGLVDPWSLGLARRLWAARREAHWRPLAVDLALVLVVCGLIVASGAMLALAVGVAASVVVYLWRSSADVLRRMADGARLRSETARGPAALALLDEHGAAIRVLTVQGPVFFGSAEQLADAIERLAEARVIVLDLTRMATIDSTGIEVLKRVDGSLAKRGCRLLLAGLPEGDPHRPLLSELGWASVEAGGRVLPDLNAALTAAEDALLAALGPEEAPALQLEAHPALAGLDRTQIDLLATVAERRAVPAGGTIIREGEPADGLWLLTAGQMTATRSGAEGRQVRLRAFRAGATIGEEALLGAAERPASVTADRDSVAWRLVAGDLEMLGRIDWRIPYQLMRNVNLGLAAQNRRLAGLALEGG